MKHIEMKVNHVKHNTENYIADYLATLGIKPEDIGRILESGNRTAAGPTVHPGGRYMTHLWYDDGVENFECTPVL